MKDKTAGTVDSGEIARFSALADQWWDERGKFRPLHRIGPLRIGYIRDAACKAFGLPTDAPRPLEGLRLLDIGCGGGLIAEPMRRLGAEVVAIDASEKNIAVASLHAQSSGLAIDYRCTTAEALAESGERFDVVLALEIIEHVADVPVFVSAAATLLRPGGLTVYSTLNRTPRAFALAIVGAEYVLRWVPAGTHDWRKFLRPSELTRELWDCGLTVQPATGMVFSPLKNEWRLDARDLSVNYLLCALRPSSG